MRIVFMGSAELSCKSLEALLKEPDIDVALIVTQPDRRKGRNLKMSSCPARLMADELGIKVISPESVNDPDSIRELTEANADCFAVVAYGHLLNSQVLSLPPKGCINVHTSLLPQYRGAAPIQRAVANGDECTGVTTMHLNEGMDTGDVIYQDKEKILPEDTGGSLHDRLAIRGAALLVRTLRDLAAGTAPRVAQDHASATIAPKLSKQDGRIDWQESSKVIYNKIRAFNPWPVCWFESGDAIAKTTDCHVRIFRAECIPGSGDPGQVMKVDRSGVEVGTGDGLLRILELQAEGGKRMMVEDFVRGHLVIEGKEFS
jgi:methionyl-tRNA formyltransferase